MKGVEAVTELQAESESKDEGNRDEEAVRLAVLDMGSTSFHLLVADVFGDGSITPVSSERVMLQLGSVLGGEGSIPQEMCTQVVDVARLLRGVAERDGATRFIPIATAALREASNGEELTAKLSRSLGTTVRLLCGKEEARIIFNASMHRLPEAQVHEPEGVGRLALDLGGGSLELAQGRAGKVLWEHSLPLGTTRMACSFMDSDPPRKREVRAIRERVRKKLEQSAGSGDVDELKHSIAMGGTARALARRALFQQGEKRRSAINGYFLSLSELIELRRELISVPLAERMTIPGVSSRRAAVLPAGAIVLETLALEWGLEGFQICDWGVRQGILLEEVGIHWGEAGD